MWWPETDAILRCFSTFDVHSARKGYAGALRVAILRGFLTFHVRFVRKGCARHWRIALLLVYFDVQHPFRAKGLRGQLQNCNFTPVLDVQRARNAARIAFRDASTALPTGLKRERKKSDREKM